MSVTYLTKSPIDATRLIATVLSPERGGIAAFVGVVRSQHQGKAVTRLEYSAYPEMAEAECARIVTEVGGPVACAGCPRAPAGHA